MDARIESMLFWVGVVLAAAVVAAWMVLRLPAPPILFHNVIFVVTLFVSIPLGVILTLGARVVLGGSPHRVLWITNPVVQRVFVRAVPPSEALNAAKARLAERGFTMHESTAPTGEAELTFEKPKLGQIQNFMDHRFTGTLAARGTADGTSLDIALGMEDTLLVETGERERLEQLAAYLCHSADTLAVKTTPFTLVCGYAAVLAVAPALLIASWVGHPAAYYLPSGLLASAVLIAVGGWGFVHNRVHLRGLRLAVVGVGFAASPWLGSWLQ